MRGFVVITALLALIVSACGSRTDHKEPPMPRPEAYFRLELPDTTYLPQRVGDEIIMLNAVIDSIETRSMGNNHWLTATYPDGRATLYLTITDVTPATEPLVLENRTERMSLNTGGNQCYIENFRTGKGRTATLLVTPSGSPTPVQLMVVGHGDKIITVAAGCEEAATARADSIQPVVDMLARDLTHMSATL